MLSKLMALYVLIVLLEKAKLERIMILAEDIMLLSIMEIVIKHQVLCPHVSSANSSNFPKNIKSH